MRRFVLLLIFIVVRLFNVYAVTIDASSVTFNASSAFYTDVTVTGDMLGVLVAYSISDYNCSVESISLGDISLTRTSRMVATFNSALASEFWYTFNNTTGTASILLTNTTTAICSAIVFSGVNTGNAFIDIQSMAGQDVTNIHTFIQQEPDCMIIGFGITNSDAYSYVLTGQTEVYNVYYNNLRSQALYGIEQESGQLLVPNYVNKPSDWIVLLLSIANKQ